MSTTGIVRAVLLRAFRRACATFWGKGQALLDGAVLVAAYFVFGNWFAVAAVYLVLWLVVAPARRREWRLASHITEGVLVLIVFVVGTVIVVVIHNNEVGWSASELSSHWWTEWGAPFFGALVGVVGAVAITYRPLRRQADIANRTQQVALAGHVSDADDIFSLTMLLAGSDDDEAATFVRERLRELIGKQLDERQVGWTSTAVMQLRRSGRLNPGLLDRLLSDRRHVFRDDELLGVLWQRLGEWRYRRTLAPYLPAAAVRSMHTFEFSKYVLASRHATWFRQEYDDDVTRYVAEELRRLSDHWDEHDEARARAAPKRRALRVACRVGWSRLMWQNAWAAAWTFNLGDGTLGGYVAPLAKEVSVTTPIVPSLGWGRWTIG